MPKRFMKIKKAKEKMSKMKFISYQYDINNTKKQLIDQQTCICLGFFDGFHQAHLKIINKTISLSKSEYLQAIFCTLSKLVVDFLNNTHLQIVDNFTKKQIVAQFAFDYYIEYLVNEASIKVDKNEFLQILCQQFNVKKVVVGKHYRFGHKALGTVEDLIAFFGQENVIIIELVEDEEQQPISSSKIRGYLNNNDLVSANNLLYKNYQITGEVVTHQKLARKLGYPTANIVIEDDLLVEQGVYITQTFYENKLYPSLTCYMTKDNGDKVVETHLLHQNMDMYGKNIRVEFLKFIRKNIKVQSLDQIIELIKQDYQIALAYFGK